MRIYKNAKRDLSIVAMLGEGATQTDVGKMGLLAGKV